MPIPSPRTHQCDIHRTHSHQDPYPTPTHESADVKHRQRRRAALERAPDDAQQGAELDVAFAAVGVTSPHHKEGAHGAAGAEEAVGGGDSTRGAAGVARFVLLGEVKVEVPAWLADG